MKMTLKRTGIIVASLSMALTSLSAQLEIDGYENKYIEDFRYGLFVPPDYNPDTAYHLMIWLHGSNYLNDDNHIWYQPEWQARYPTIVLTPKCRPDQIDAGVPGWSGWGNSVDMVDTWCVTKAFQALDSTKKYYTIDTTRMHIAGHSMGAIGTFYFLSSRPGMFASAWAASGGGDTINIEPLLETPLWIFHGGSDNNVPNVYSRGIYKALLEAGGTKVRYSEYPGVGHNDVFGPIGQENTLRDWNFMQQLGADHQTPATTVSNFEIALNTNNKPRLSWEAPQDKAGIDNYIWAYHIYRDSVVCKTIDRDSTFFTDLGAKAGTSYTYSIAPMNYFFLEAEQSAEIQITTAAVDKVQFYGEEKGITVFPNPVYDKLYINHTSKPENISYQLFTAQGKLVLAGSLIANEIDLSSLRRGVYLIQIKTDTEIHTTKIIKL